jgi:predicted PurR-regulated permease PerM
VFDVDDEGAGGHLSTGDDANLDRGGRHAMAGDPATNRGDGPPDVRTWQPVDTRTVFRWSVTAALGVLLVFALALFAINARNLLVQIAVAAFIAVSLDPAVRWMVRHRVRRSIAVAIIFIAFMGLITLFVWLAMPPLLRQAASLTADFPGYVDKLRATSPGFANLEDRLGLKPEVDEFARTFLDRIQRDAFAFGQRFLGALFSALLVIVLTIYFMADLPRIRRGIVRLSPIPQRPRVGHGVNVVVDKVGAYMIGNLVISLFAGVSSFIALVVLDVPFALPLAVFVALTDLIPLIGATLGAVVCTIVAIATTDLWPNAVILAIFFLVYQQVENYLIAPVVFRNSVDMPAVAVLLAALVGGTLLGLVGALMAIPVAAAIKVLGTPMIQARDAAHAERLAEDDAGAG